MTTEEERLAVDYGITAEQKTVYTYKGHKYERRQDALSYAEIDTRRNGRTSVVERR